MGKAAKQKANRLAKQIKNNKDNKDFLEMIEAMQDDKPYQIKKGNGYLFAGASFKGSHWKAMFLKPKNEESDGQS
jgi:3-methyladenine DNA glycosylase AlkD